MTEPRVDGLDLDLPVGDPVHLEIAGPPYAGSLLLGRYLLPWARQALLGCDAVIGRQLAAAIRIAENRLGR